MSLVLRALAMSILLCAPLQAQVVAIKAVRLIDTEAGSVLTNQTVLVRGGKIESVGANVSVPADAKVIDLSGYTVLPGLIDCHTHLSDVADDPDPLGVLHRTAAEVAFASIPNAKTALLAGFTTVRDVGPYRALMDVAIREAIAKGIVIGPRMFVAGAYVTITGGAGAVAGFSPHGPPPWAL